ncbi:vitamin B12-dependent ribonucleotide reductase [Candidatus Saccharibacteria bacterium]|jgi:ribonucleoside-diphosphate reductase alpha chain|nr:vitamin B12-dependent ribonucleotide reductase [Candidatus Saccharibacteria bacterium]HOR23172.1 vitamin B12-dependent ribonucleotide reductase [Candidatus Saccharibacteria bacterium]
MSQTGILGINKLFTTGYKDPYSYTKWVKRDAQIINPVNNQVVFEQKNVEFPDDWSLNAVNIVAQKYFAGTPGSPEREFSLRQLIDRVVNTITTYGFQNGYFDDKKESKAFSEELKYILASQRASFNSPVWFNIGAEGRKQQASACFILGIEDDMKSILNWYVEEGVIFKGGSGSGINLSAIRSSSEYLSASGGKASGPVSFMRGADASAGTIKSGGKTRRAAKMVILNADHPDIEEFIWCKAIEERKARVLQEAGFDMDLDGKDSFSVQYQNANNSVRVTDDFMKAVEKDEDWGLKAITTGAVLKTVKAKDLFRQFAEATWECADPGMQFDSTINKWHTTPNAGRINASNPCSEYMHLDNSACNLASINLLKFLNSDGSFDIEAFKHTVDTIFLAQELLVGYSSYPTENISKNAKSYRALGLGYANLGALLMAQGLPYDSEDGRAQAATITALLTGQAYSMSAKIAKKVGPFAGFNKDKKAMLGVIKMHRKELKGIDARLVPEELLNSASEAWEEAVQLSEEYGVRNCQASVLAPTGTIGFMMDCDTTGIEPDLGLIKIKKLVGGGVISIVNQTVERSLRALGYTKTQTDNIIAYIDKEKTIVGAPGLKEEHTSVFACSMGDNSIHYMGHIKMMAAVQPFLSGAISKTVNLPESVTVEDIEQLHIEAWKMGLKAVAIYRDGCKVGQPLATAKKDSSQSEIGSSQDSFILKGAIKRELPKRRKSYTYKFQIADLKGYFTVGEFDDGTPGELFMRVAKQGSTLSGLMDSFAISVSHGLQYGVPLKSYVRTLMGTSFAPSGITSDEDIRMASSVTDYVVRRLAMDYLSFDDRLELGLADIEDMPDNQTTLLSASDTMYQPNVDKDKDVITTDNVQLRNDKGLGIANDISAPLCYNCGNQTQRAGSCYVCTSCGSTTGCS